MTTQAFPQLWGLRKIILLGPFNGTETQPQKEGLQDRLYLIKVIESLVNCGAVRRLVVTSMVQIITGVFLNHGILQGVTSPISLCIG